MILLITFTFFSSKDTSDDSLLGNWRRVAAAEEIYDIIKEVHEQNVPHKNYRNTYLDVSISILKEYLHREVSVLLTSKR